MRILLPVFAALGCCSLLSGQANDPSVELSSQIRIFGDDFRYAPKSWSPTEKNTSRSSDGEIVKMQPFTVYIWKKSIPSMAVTKPDQTKLDLDSERKLWSGAIGRLPIEIGVLKHVDIIPFGEPTNRWEIIRVKW